MSAHVFLAIAGKKMTNLLHQFQKYSINFFKAVFYVLLIITALHSYFILKKLLHSIHSLTPTIQESSLQDNYFFVEKPNLLVCK